MKKMLPVLLVGAALVGYIAGYASKPSPQQAPQAVLTGHFDDLSMIPSANAQENKPEVMPFNFNSPREPQLAPDAPPVTTARKWVPPLGSWIIWPARLESRTPGRPAGPERPQSSSLLGMAKLPRQRL